MKDNREYRSFQLSASSDDSEFIAAGYASTFERYLLYKDDEYEIYEQVDEHAFDDADFTDCVFRVDHQGHVYARTSAGTLRLRIDENLGLYQEADLSKTSSARSLYEDIKAGNYPQMSFAFTVKEDSFNRETKTRTIYKIDKVFDVSPVTWPANPTTSLSARSQDFIDGAINELKESERIQAEREELINTISKNLGDMTNDT